MSQMCWATKDASLALQTAGYGPLAAPHAAFLGRLARLAGFLGLQLSGQPLGAHAAFRSYGADAVSLRPVLLAQGQSVGRGVRRASGADAALELAKVRGGSSMLKLLPIMGTHTHLPYW